MQGAALCSRMRFFFQAIQRQDFDDSAGLVRLLADTIPGLVSYIDKDLRYRFLNARYRDWFGIEPTSFVGRTPRDLLGPVDYRAFEPYLRRALAGIESEARLPLATPMGKRMIRGVAMPHTLADGSVAGVFVLTMDITEEHAAGEALREARDQALAANEAKSRFLAAATHDLRQPIHAMTLFASALSRRVKEEEARSLVGNLQAILDSLTRMFNSLLDLSKIDSGLVNVEMAEVPLGPVLLRIASELRGQARERGLSLRIVPTRLVVRSDAILLENILRNLVANALKFTRRGGVVVGVRRGAGGVRLAVYDTGPGIETDRMERIFEEYERSREAANGANPGLGLGLAIVRRLARLIGHEVTVRSLPGRGSVFAIGLGAARAPREAGTAPAAPRAASDIRGAHIVLIDDDPLILAALAAEFSDLGATAVGASSGEQVLERLRAGSWPDLMLIDYDLGGPATGLDFLYRVERELGRRPNAIIITGTTSPDAIRAVRESGHPKLIKPVEPAALRAAIGAALSGARAERPVPQPARGS
jgi:signal transduction histidine kinase/ActR/RegA family two-component response regulator